MQGRVEGVGCEDEVELNWGRRRRIVIIMIITIIAMAGKGVIRVRKGGPIEWGGGDGAGGSKEGGVLRDVVFEVWEDGGEGG